MTTTDKFSVRNAAGLFLGRTTMTGPLTWQQPAFAYVYRSRAEAEAVAAAHGGTVCPSPRWDSAAGKYVF